MNYEAKGIHYEVSDTTREHIDKKMKRLQFASDLVTDISLSLIRRRTDTRSTPTQISVGGPPLI